MKFCMHTISDLIIELFANKKNNRKEVENEIVYRLKYCGFDDNTIGYFISYEKAIIKKRNINDNYILLLNRFFWYNKRINDCIFDNPNDYVLIPGELPKTQTLLICELLCIIDEANILRGRNFKYNNYVQNELKILGNEDFNNWVFYEFYNRLENEFRFANNITNKYKKMLFQEQIEKLYENEMGIIMINRWKNIMPKDALFIPYK